MQKLRTSSSTLSTEHEERQAQKTSITADQQTEHQHDQPRMQNIIKHRKDQADHEDTEHEDHKPKEDQAENIKHRTLCTTFIHK